MSRLRHLFERSMELIVIILMITLAVEVLLGVTYRKLGMSLSWYDEVASVTLAWLTYYGAALAALKRAHIGFPGLVDAVKPSVRIPMIIVGEICVIAFFAVMAWQGIVITEVLATDYLVSLPWIPASFTQSVIPIGAVLFIVAELLRISEVVMTKDGADVSDIEV